MRSIRARAALSLASVAALTGLVLSLVAVALLRGELRADAIGRARLVADGVEPVAVEVMLTPGSPDLELALIGRLAALRRSEGVRKIAVFDRDGVRVPPVDDGEAPAIRGNSELFALHGDTVIVGHPITRDGVDLGYLAVELSYPRAAVWRAVGALAAVTALITALASGLAALVAGPLTAALRAIAANIDHLGRGETWIAQPMRSGLDELGRLGDAVRSLASRLDAAAAERARPMFPRDAPEDPVRWPSSPAPVAHLGAEIEAAASRSGAATEIGLSGVGAQLDLDHLNAVIEALVSNARRHAPEAEVVVSAHVDGDQLVVAVRDTGPGLPPAVASAPFQPIPGGGDGGFGTGLALAARRARAMGGRLEHDSRYTRGARLVLRVPLIQEATSA